MQKAMQLVLEDFMTAQKQVDKKLASMEARQSALEVELAAERKMRKTAERKVKSRQEKLDYANLEPDRANEKDRFQVS